MTILSDIFARIEAKRELIETWFQTEEARVPPALFLSCDIRHSGNKIAVVDSNLFPAGFNNLCTTYHALAIRVLKETLERRFPGISRILLLAESHTRNKFYFDNLAALSHMIVQAGYDCRLAMSEPDFVGDEMRVTLDDTRTLSVYAIREANIEHHEVSWPDFTPEIILSNNDFSTALPSYSQGLTQPIVPSPRLGWLYRKKSDHFNHLREVTRRFCEQIDVDPWYLFSAFDVVKDVAFETPEGQQVFSSRVRIFFDRLKQDALIHGREEDPYAFIKNDSGTYGMGVMSIHHPDEVAALNRKMRNKLLSSKGGAKATQFLLQEGVPTDDFYSEQPIEPVIYLIGGRFVGGFFRIHAERDAYASLNSPGMQFSCLCLHKLNEPHEQPFLNCCEKSELVAISIYLARLAALAAGMEALDIQ